MEVRKHLDQLKAIVKFNLKIETRYPISYMAGFLNMFFWLFSFSILVLMFSRGTGEEKIIGNIIMWGFVAYLIFQGILGEVGFGLIRLQRRGTLEQILLTPISPWILPLGLAGFTIIIHMLFVMLAIFLFCTLMKVPIIIKNPLGGFLAGVLFFMMAYGLALLYAGWALKAKRSGWALINAIQIIVMLFCGVFYSFRTTPQAILTISRIIPLSYAIDLFRTTIVGIEPELVPSVIIIFGAELSGYLFEWILVSTLSILLLLLGYIYLMKSVEDAKMKGYLATY